MRRILVLALAVVTVFVTSGCGGEKRTKAKFNKKLQADAKARLEDTPFGKTSASKKCLQVPDVFKYIQQSKRETVSVFTADVQPGVLRNMQDDSVPVFEASENPALYKRFVLTSIYRPMVVNLSGEDLKTLTLIESLGAEALDGDCDILTVRVGAQNVPFTVVVKTPTALRAKNKDLDMVLSYQLRRGKLFMTVYKPTELKRFEETEMPSHIRQTFVLAFDQGLQQAVISQNLASSIKSCLGANAPPELNSLDQENKGYVALSFPAYDSTVTLLNETTSDKLLCK